MGRACHQQERAVPLVHVVDVWLDVHLLEELVAAEPQDHLLPQTVGGIASIQPVGDRTVFRTVFWNIGV